MKRVAFDVMGNDHGVAGAVQAVNAFVAQHHDFYFILVGDQTIIHKYLVANKNIEVLDAKQVVSIQDGLRATRKSNSSMTQAINLVAQGKANVVVSSGDSGAYLALATLNLKRLPGIKRPAFMPVFPTVTSKKFLMADVGANLEVTGDMLVQWAKIGQIFASRVLKISNPRVGIVNIGHEAYKGKPFHLAAHQALAGDPAVNFGGFVEPRDLLNGIVDVAVIDGYAGNMVLKTLEGAITSLLALIKTAIGSKLQYKIGAFISKGAFQKIKVELDYRNVGSAWVIGLNHLVVKCHGGADKQSYLGAFNQIKIALDQGLEDAFQGGQYE